MAVIKTKTKFTKSKFTKNKYSTKKKNVSRMTKKMNVMKGGGKGKPVKPGKSGKSLGRSGSGSMSKMRVRGSRGTNSSPYVNIAPTPKFNNNFSKQYFLGEGSKYNRGSRFARINGSQLKSSLTNNTKSLENKKKIIFKTLRGKYEPEFVRYAMSNPDNFTQLLNNSKDFKTQSGIYVNVSTNTNNPVYSKLNPERANIPLPPIPGYSVLQKTPKPLYATIP